MLLSPCFCSWKGSYHSGNHVICVESRIISFYATLLDMWKVHASAEKLHCRLLTRSSAQLNCPRDVRDTHGELARGPFHVATNKDRVVSRWEQKTTCVTNAVETQRLTLLFASFAFISSSYYSASRLYHILFMSVLRLFHI